MRVFGDGACPTYTTGQDIDATWDLTSPARCVTPPEQALDDDWSDATLLRVLTAGGVVKGEWAFDPDGSAVITNAALVAALGAETDFILRAYNQRAGLNSLTSDTITVTRI